MLEVKNNMTVMKMAFRNLVRFPRKTILYGLAVFLLSVAVIASLFVYHASDIAVTALDENYVFVASLVKRTQTGEIPLSEVFKCTGYDKLTAFNLTVSEGEGVLPGGSALTKLPSADNPHRESKDDWIEEFCCPVYGVENLGLVYPFFAEECKITQGTALTEKGYSGEIDEIVIPWWLAERYGLKVGDTVNRRYLRQTGEFSYIYIPTTVAGIYTSSDPSPDIKNYPAYISLALAEADYGKILPNTANPKTIGVERADFVLKSREDFADFVAFAESRGLDFTSVSLIFNNSTYDVLHAELKNIGIVTLLVLIVSAFVGMGILLFLTVYLCKLREKETTVLYALGMKKVKIHAMLAMEFSILIAVFSSLGFLVGKTSAEAVCSFVNDTVLERASASEEIQNLHSSADFAITMPLEKDFDMEISTVRVNGGNKNIGFHSLQTPLSHEIGISRHGFYLFMTDSENAGATPDELKSFETRAKVRVDIVGATDLSVFDLTVKTELPENFIAIYVNENSPYADESGLFLSSDDFGDYVSVSLYEAKISPDGGRLGQVHLYYIAGTYRAGAYCSDNDILVSMEDYHRIYSDISVTDREHHFKRIGAVYQKEGSR